MNLFEEIIFVVICVSLRNELHSIDSFDSFCIHVFSIQKYNLYLNEVNKSTIYREKYMANDKILYELKMSQQWKLHFKMNKERERE